LTEEGTAAAPTAAPDADPCGTQLLAMEADPAQSIGALCDACESFDGRFGQQCMQTVHKGMKKGLCQKTSSTDTYCYDAYRNMDEFTNDFEVCSLYSQCSWFFQMSMQADAYCTKNDTDVDITNLDMYADCQQTIVNGEPHFCDERVHPDVNDNTVRDSDQWVAACGDCFDYTSAKFLVDGAQEEDEGETNVIMLAEECTFCTTAEIPSDSAGKIPPCASWMKDYRNALMERVSAGRGEPDAATTTAAPSAVVSAAGSTAPMLCVLGLAASVLLQRH